MKLAVCVSSLLAAAFVNAANITVATQDVGLSTFSPVVDSNGALIPDAGGYVAIGVTTLTDAQVGDIGTDLVALNAFLADFTQFGASSTFGGAGIFNEPSLFNFSADQSTAGSNPFSGNPIYLVAGNGADLNSSTDLFVYKFDTNYETDDPLFSTTVTTNDSGTLLFGDTQSSIALPNAGTHDGFAMAAVVPEPSIALLGALGVLGLIRRRR